jgi:hypothetical protein
VAGASPDGSTREEIAITCQNSHPSLTQVLALVVPQQQQQQQQQHQAHECRADTGVTGNGASMATNSSSSTGADEVITGLVMELVQGQPLADRPTSQHLLRCK